MSKGMPAMQIALGSDHAGFELKSYLKGQLEARGYQVVDFGTHTRDAVDYPDIARPLAEAVSAGTYPFGILVCSNGVGVSIVANKVPGVRAALCADTFTARRARAHTDCNILCLGGWTIGPGLATEIVDVFLATEFEGGRHERRVHKIKIQDAERATTGA
jgi:ribose 5-phosphate isomerase B